MRKFFEIGGVVAGVVLIAFGVAAIVLGVHGKNTVATSLKWEGITGTPDMTPAAIKTEAVQAKLDLTKIVLPTCTVANVPVTNGDQARCFAQYMRIHTLEHTGGYTYSQMGIWLAKDGTPPAQLMPGGGTDNPTYAATDATTNAPVSNSARDIWVTETALTTALNSSYMAEQMANFGIVVGIALLLSGIGFMILALGGALEGERLPFRRPATVKAPAVPVA